MGDRAVLLRLALGDTDLHLAVLEVRPAFVEVDGGLLEPESVAIEAPRALEISDVIPDRRGHQARAPGRDPRERTSAS